ncbi:amino acid adenylation domain-containing protein [Streptomyces sp. NPDC091377]|uniref:amino acid adenylation domain-containing protein n=1 Tax=Streptomyces sp. NPDC091377 TaxID=3365995 RepID=UPI0038286E56
MHASDSGASRAQERMLAGRTAGGPSPYHLVVSADVTGPLDAGRLREAVARLARRRPALRTLFTRPADGRATAVRVAADWRPPVLEQELPPAPEGADPVELVENLLVAAAPGLLRPYDRPPAVFVLTSAGPERAVLSVLAHQAVVGVRDTARLWEELVAAYRDAKAARSAAELPPDAAPAPAPAPTADLLTERVRQLADWPGVVELPSDLTRPPARTFTAARLPFTLPGTTLADGTRLARRLDVPWDAVLLAGWALAVARRAGVDRLLVETRPTAGTGLVACEIPGDDSVEAYVRRTAGAMAQSARYDGVPFDDLAEALGADADPARHPLVQFAYGSAEGTEGADGPRELVADGVRFEVRPARLGGIAHDAVLRARDGAGGLELEYAAAALSPQEAADLAAGVVQALTDLAADPRARTAELTTVTAAQRRRLEAVERGPGVDCSAGLWQLIEEAAARHPDAIAVRDPDSSLTYRQFIAAAGVLAAELAGVGVREGDRVAVAARRSVDQIVAVAAIVRSGAAYVGVESDMPPAAAATILDTAGVRVVLGDKDRVAALGAAADGRVTLPVAGPRTGGPVPPPAPADPERAAYLTFTSGTTGRPKGAVIPCRAVVRLSRRAGWLLPGAAARFLRIAPMAFDAFTLEVFPVLLAGGTLEVFTDEHITVGALTSFLEERAVTGLYLSSGLFRLVADFRPDAFRSAVQVLTGGEVVPAEQTRQVLRACPGLTVSNGFGHSENTSFTVVHHVSDPAEVGDALPVGRPIDGTGVLVLDGAGRTVPPGAVGELFTYGDGLAQGYAGLPDETAESFGDFGRPEGRRLYRTGDLVRWGGDGHLRYVGRRDRQVKIRGFRVEPDHVAGVLRAHPGVRDAAVAVVAEGDGDKLLLAAVAPLDGRALPPDLRSYAEQRLPSYARPKRWAAVEEFPVTRNGKLDVARLTEIAGPFPDAPQHPATPAAPVTPATPAARTYVPPTDANPQPDKDPQPDGERLAEAVTEAWEQVLGHRDFGPADWFFDVGGDSLRLIRVHAILSRTLPAWNITISDLYTYPTIDDLVAVLYEESADGSAEGASAHAPA